MDVEGVFASCIICFVAMIFLIIGFCQFRSKEPVGFYSGEKPPARDELTDVKSWNHGHGILWLLYGGGIIVAWFIGYAVAVLANCEIISAIVMIVSIVGGLGAIIAGDYFLRKKYMQKK